MTGFPDELRTKQDYCNAVAEVEAGRGDRAALLARLNRMRASTTMMQLKEEAKSKRAEKQRQADYAPAPDPCCEMRRLGFSPAELESLMGRVAACSG